MFDNNFTQHIKLMVSQWEELKEDLYSGKVEYTDLEKLKTYTFFKVLNDIFTQTRHFFEVPLMDFRHMYRAVNEKQCDYERFVPKLVFATSYNRMNPPDKVFLYLGVQSVGEQEFKKKIVSTCLREIRAPLDSVATICKFEVTESGNKKKVIDICGDPKIPQHEADLIRYITKKYKKTWLKKGSYKARIELSHILAKVYFNLFSSDQIFKPIDSGAKVEEKKREYAPFHALAHYINEAGYDGMIYRSTVFKGGKNLVLFDTKDATYVLNTMEQVKVSHYLP